MASTEASAELANAMSRVLDVGSLSRSNHFAELLQRAAVASMSHLYAEVLDEGVKSAGFYVLAGARMPAALFETSFISNVVEERRLDTGDYRQKMADAIVNAVRAYRDGNVSGGRRDQEIPAGRRPARPPRSPHTKSPTLASAAPRRGSTETVEETDRPSPGLTRGEAILMLRGPKGTLSCQQ